MSVELDDRRRLDALHGKIRHLHKLELTVGVHSDAPAHKDDKGEPINMAQLAAVHEFGTSRIPERSFLRAGVASKQTEIGDRAKLGVQRLVDGEYDAPEVLEFLGELILGDIRELLQAGVKPELSATTIASRDKKAGHGGGVAGMAGSHTPLIDTGQLIGSLAYKVGGEGDKR